MKSQLSPCLRSAGIIVTIMRRLPLALTFTVAAAASLLLGSVALAASPNVSRSFAYQSSQKITAGSLVSLTKSHGSVVQLANTSNGQQLVGVAVDSTDSLLAVNPNLGRVQVATSGSVYVLASTIDGNIAVGDMVAVSPLDGLGMDAKPGDRVIGIAQTELEPTTSGVKTERISDQQGKDYEVSAGKVLVSLNIGTAPSATANLNGLQRFARSLTGHVVSTARLVVSLIITVLAFGSLITLVYASIYGGIISIGRNPLARVPVLNAVRDALIMSSFIAILAAVAIFLLLR